MEGSISSSIRPEEVKEGLLLNQSSQFSSSTWHKEVSRWISWKVESEILETSKEGNRYSTFFFAKRIIDLHMNTTRLHLKSV
jgi:hypothetical protein